MLQVRWWQLRVRKWKQKVLYAIWWSPEKICGFKCEGGGEEDVKILFDPGIKYFWSGICWQQGRVHSGFLKYEALIVGIKSIENPWEISCKIFNGNVEYYLRKRKRNLISIKRFLSQSKKKNIWILRAGKLTRTDFQGPNLQGYTQPVPDRATPPFRRQANNEFQAFLKNYIYRFPSITIIRDHPFRRVYLCTFTGHFKFHPAPPPPISRRYK